MTLETCTTEISTQLFSTNPYKSKSQTSRLIGHATLCPVKASQIQASLSDSPVNFWTWNLSSSAVLRGHWVKPLVFHLIVMPDKTFEERWIVFERVSQSKQRLPMKQTRFPSTLWDVPILDIQTQLPLRRASAEDLLAQAFGMHTDTL